MSYYNDMFTLITENSVGKELPSNIKLYKEMHIECYWIQCDVNIIWMSIIDEFFRKLKHGDFDDSHYEEWLREMRRVI